MNIEIGTRESAIRRGRLLEYLTIIWNLLEGIISVGAGVIAGSIALVGFGFDSFIESASGGALLWCLHLDAPERRERAEYIALKLVGISFLLLAAFVAFDAIKSLIKREPPEASYIGIAMAALSLIVMPFPCASKATSSSNDQQPRHESRFKADGYMRLSVCNPIRRTDPECAFRLVVG